MNPLEVLDLSSTLVSSHIKKIDSSYKRRKNITSNPLKSLFERDEFRAVYFEHNSGNEREHKCIDDVYERFCCGAKYKKTDLFQKSNYCLQI